MNGTEAGWHLLHFAMPEWLWFLPLGLLPWAVHLWRQRGGGQRLPEGEAALQAYADPHLLPYLLREGAQDEGSRGLEARFGWLRPLLMGWVWLLLALALAQPRWSYTEQTVYAPDAALVVALDLSRSMLAADVKPNRLARARQEISDLLREAKGRGIAVGLIAFAETDHILTPVTSNLEAVRQVLPALEVDLLRVQGSNPAPAIERAADQLYRFQLLQGGENQHILLLTDGDLQEGRYEALRGEVAKLAKGDGKASPIRLSVMTVGTEAGAPVPGRDGRSMTDSAGRVHLARLNAAQMEGLADAGQGVWVQADFRREDTERLLRQFGARQGERREETHRIWDEGYWLPLLLAMAGLLTPWLRRLVG